VLIVGAEVGGRPGTDVRVAGDRVAEVAPGLRRSPGEPTIEARGGALIPGLHDHHVHLRSLAASRASVAVGPPDVTDRAGLAAVLRRADGRAGPGDWIRAVGYHESVAGALDRTVLDALVPDRPLRVQHRSGELWFLNTPALAAAGLGTPSARGPAREAVARGPVERDGGGRDRVEPDGVERDRDGQATGRLWRADGWLATVVPAPPLDLDGVSRDAAALGVAGFTDANPERSQAGVDALQAAAVAGELRQRVVLMSAGGLDIDPAAGLAAGPRKLLLDDATLPALDDLAATIVAAHGRGEPVAVHCVTRLQLVITLAALAQAGPHAGDRIEHAAVVPPELRAELRRLGVTVVTQPNFVAERGDQYLADVDEADVDLLYPCATLRAAGIPVAGGTDAPFGRPDPWAAMRAAVERRAPSGAVVGGHERIGARAALGLFLGHPDDPALERRVQHGAPADLCLLDRPLAPALAVLSSDLVALTVIGGRVRADNR
jgi:predicted amidohydrolase YtcJ